MSHVTDLVKYHHIKSYRVCYIGVCNAVLCSSTRNSQFIHVRKAMSDVWKKFSIPAIGFPWSVFALLEDCSLENWQDKWIYVLQTQSRCPECIDLEFTGVLIRMHSPLPDLHNTDAWTKLRSSITEILEETAVMCPLNSESVENKHAVTQTLFSKSRGRIKCLSTAVEESLIDAIVRSYSSLKSQVTREEQPSRLLPALSRLGNRTRGAYSQPDGLFEPGCKLVLEERVQAARKKKIRRMTGFCCSLLRGDMNNNSGLSRYE